MKVNLYKKLLMYITFTLLSMIKITTTDEQTCIDGNATYFSKQSNIARKHQ